MYDENLIRRSISHFESTSVYLPPEDFAASSFAHEDVAALAPGCFVGVMRLFGPLFSAATPGAATAAASSTRVASAAKAKPKATDRLTLASEAIEARAALLAERAATLRVAARSAFAAGDKKGAIMALKRAKQADKQAETASMTAMALEQQLDVLETNEVQRVVSVALSSAVKGSQKRTKGLLGRAEDAVEGASEMADLSADLSAVFGELGQAGANDFDDDELAAELEALVQEPDEGLSKATAPATATVKAPTVAASALRGTIGNFPSVPLAKEIEAVEGVVAM